MPVLVIYNQGPVATGLQVGALQPLGICKISKVGYVKTTLGSLSMRKKHSSDWENSASSKRYAGSHVQNAVPF